MTIVRVKYEKTDTGFRSVRKHRIYYDTGTGEYKTKFRCMRCGVDLGCFCFENLDEAIISRGDGVCCVLCGLIDHVENDAWVREEVQEILGVPFEQSITRAIRKATDDEIYQVMKIVYDDVDFEFNGWMCKV